MAKLPVTENWGNMRGTKTSPKCNEHQPDQLCQSCHVGMGCKARGGSNGVEREDKAHPGAMVSDILPMTKVSNPPSECKVTLGHCENILLPILTLPDSLTN